MTFKKKLTIGFLGLFGAVLLFAQSRPTAFSSILIKTRNYLDKPLEIDLIASQTANPVTIKNSSGSTIAKIDSTGAYTGGILPNTVSSGTAPVHIYDAAGPPLVTTTGTDTAGVATTTWVNEVFVPGTRTFTGISYLIGSVGGTDKAIAILFDSAGNVVANSSTSGVTVGTTATFQRLAFTSAYTALGPAKYYIGISTNGTTAKIRTQAFGDNDAGTITGGTFGTLVAITPPSTFTASQGPIAMLY